jgi:hypothetical protein
MPFSVCSKPRRSGSSLLLVFLSRYDLAPEDLGVLFLFFAGESVIVSGSVDLVCVDLAH